MFNYHLRERTFLLPIIQKSMYFIFWEKNEKFVWNWSIVSDICSLMFTHYIYRNASVLKLKDRKCCRSLYLNFTVFVIMNTRLSQA